jgi:hypothetical protein
MRISSRFGPVLAALSLALAAGLAGPVSPAQALTPKYALPFQAGYAARISQTPGGSPNHTDVYNSSAVDWAVPSGTPVVASQTGKVYFEGWNGPGGIVALIDHGGDNCSQYAHLRSTIIDKGQRVLRGQVIGYSGASSNGSQSGVAPHLHWAGVACSTSKAKFTINTEERGTSYPVGVTVTSKNAGASLTNTRSGRCLDVKGGSTTPGTAVQLYDCNGTSSQMWKATNGELRVFSSTRCLDISGGAIKSGTLIQSYTCNGTSSQKWKVYADGTVRPTVATALCLDAVGGGTANGVRVQIYACNGSGAQQWK